MNMQLGSRRQLAAVGIAVVALAASGCAGGGAVPSERLPAGVAAPGQTNARVVRIVDGDTVDVLHDDRGRLRVRILGIDADELRAEDAGERCFAQRAKAFAVENLADRRVGMVGDPTQATTDRYGRTLGFVFTEAGSNFSVDIARAGLARSVVFGRKPVAAQPEIAEAEAQARAAGRGRWGSSCTAG